MSLVQTSGAELDVRIDHAAVLKSLNLNPEDPKTQALILVCERYQLDPLLKHMVLISGNPYVTRDGYLAIAHRSGVFDGMEVVSTGADQTHFLAKVAVFRKDMSRPFTMVGRFPKSKQMSKEYGPEMAIKVAEVAALRRAFNITGVGAADERWDVSADEVVAAASDPVFDAAEVQAADEMRLAPPDVQADLFARLSDLPVDYRKDAAERWKKCGFGAVKYGRLTLNHVQGATELVVDAEARWAAELGEAEAKADDERPFDLEPAS